MNDLYPLLGGLAFIIGVVGVGIGGSPRAPARSFFLLMGWLLIMAGIGAEIYALTSSHGKSAAEVSPS